MATWANRFTRIPRLSGGWRILWILTKKDLKAYFDQPTGYILLVVFAVAVSFFFFREAQRTNEASLRPLFTIMPWMLTFFVAASTMRLMAEEQRDGTLEILLTQPVKGWIVLIAKFLAGLLFVGTGIAATIGIPILLQTAGDLDQGAVIAQYIGTLFITASFVSIGLFSSSLTKNQIVAFIIGIAITFALMIAGMPLLTLALPSWIAVLVQNLSPLTHYTGIARGVLDLRDVIYFVALISTFLSGTYLLIRGKSVSHRSPMYRNLQLGVAALVVLSILIGWSGSSIRGRLDLTENKLYTLSPATSNLLANLDDTVTVKLYLSEDPPVQVSLTTRDVNDFMDDAASASNGKLRVIRLYPDVDEEAAEEAERGFVEPQPFTEQSGGEFKVKLGYLGLGMTYSNKYEVISFIDSVDGLEYQLAANIRRMSQKEQQIISFVYGHGEKRRDAELQTLRNELERYHQVEEITNPDEGFIEPGDSDVVIFAGPTDHIDSGNFFKIDQFLADGGKALFLLDPIVLDGLTADENNDSVARHLDSMYGVKLQQNVIFDIRSYETIPFGSPGREVLRPYPYWIRALAAERQISGGVTQAVFPWASSLEVVEPTAGEQVEVDVITLVETSPFAVIDSEYRDLTPIAEHLGTVTQDDQGSRTLAVALTGTRCPALTDVCEKDLSQVFRLIVATDSDWISENMVRQYPENVSMVANWIDWLTQDEELTTIRSKGAAVRELLYSSSSHQNLVEYGNIIGVPIIFVIIGLFRYFVRRNTIRKVYTSER